MYHGLHQVQHWNAVLSEPSQCAHYAQTLSTVIVCETVLTQKHFLDSIFSLACLS